VARQGKSLEEVKQRLNASKKDKKEGKAELYGLKEINWSEKPDHECEEGFGRCFQKAQLFHAG